MCSYSFYDFFWNILALTNLGQGNNVDFQMCTSKSNSFLNQFLNQIVLRHGCIVSVDKFCLVSYKLTSQQEEPTSI